MGIVPHEDISVLDVYIYIYIDINIFIRASNFIKNKTKAITKIYWLH